MYVWVGYQISCEVAYLPSVNVSSFRRQPGPSKMLDSVVGYLHSSRGKVKACNLFVNYTESMLEIANHRLKLESLHAPLFVAASSLSMRGLELLHSAAPGGPLHTSKVWWLQDSSIIFSHKICLSPIGASSIAPHSEDIWFGSRLQ